MISKLSENPLLILLTLITTALTTINTMFSTIDIPAFWLDVFISFFISYTIVCWCISIWRTAKKSKPKIGILSKIYDKPFSYLQLIKSSGVAIAALLILLGLLVYNIFLPITHVLSPIWSLCGTFVTDCNSNICLEFFDSRRRLLLDECYLLDDDTGYKELKSPRWWIYKPEFARKQCNGNAYKKIRLKNRMFNGLCSEVMQL